MAWATQHIARANELCENAISVHARISVMGLGKTLSDKRNPNFYTKKGTIVRTHADVDVDDDLAASQLCITLGFSVRSCNVHLTPHL